MAPVHAIKHFRGLWVCDPEFALATDHALVAYMFLGDGLVACFRLGETPDGHAETTWRMFAYVLEDDLMELHLCAGEEPVREGRWRIDDAGKIWMEMNDGWVPFLPTTPEELGTYGFARWKIENLLNIARQGEMPFEAVKLGDSPLAETPI
ncbi:MAG: hypothetical protein AB7P12_10920 [Alphaproteobacteria bacterium]